MSRREGQTGDAYSRGESGAPGQHLLAPRVAIPSAIANQQRVPPRSTRDRGRAAMHARETVLPKLSNPAAATRQHRQGARQKPLAE